MTFALRYLVLWLLAGLLSAIAVVLSVGKVAGAFWRALRGLRASASRYVVAYFSAVRGLRAPAPRGQGRAAAPDTPAAGALPLDPK